MMTTSTAAARGLQDRAGGDWEQITPGERFRIQVTSGQTLGAFSVVEVIAEPGNGVPMHIHGNEDEHFIVLDGTFHVAIGDSRMDVLAGESVTVPRGVPHAWCNSSKAPVHVIAVFSPGGIEPLFREVAGGRDVAEVTAIARRYGTELVGPPLRQTSHSIVAPRR